MLIDANDDEYQDLSHYFTRSIEFIHKGRHSGGNVFVHWFINIIKLKINIQITFSIFNL